MEKSKFLLILVSIISACAAEENGFAPCAAIEQQNLTNLQQEAFTNISFYGDDTGDILVYQTTYRGDVVFIEVICCPSCNTLPPSVRDRKGIRIGYLGVDIDYDILTNAIVVCRTHNGACG